MGKDWQQMEQVQVNTKPVLESSWYKVLASDKDKLERSCFCLLPAEITVTKLFEFGKSVMPPCKRGGAVGERAQEFVEHCTNTAICGLARIVTSNTSVTSQELKCMQIPKVFSVAQNEDSSHYSRLQQQSKRMPRTPSKANTEYQE
ncbi:hypothetical protein Anapl_00037 [Anas platyrhynchos]|uniref:Uncharacterized protein n=1 Tax=Anas platyrhynchos TaxID=8839 RepID=R0K2B7_ANAPL|nr:hypothetical protein Anapl_00037 [Anas platyrhynchos]